MADFLFDVLFMFLEGGLMAFGIDRYISLREKGERGAWTALIVVPIAFSGIFAVSMRHFL